MKHVVLDSIRAFKPQSQGPEEEFVLPQVRAARERDREARARIAAGLPPAMEECKTWRKFPGKKKKPVKPASAAWRPTRTRRAPVFVGEPAQHLDKATGCIVTVFAPGEALGARDLENWSHRRAIGRSGSDGISEHLAEEFFEKGHISKRPRKRWRPRSSKGDAVGPT